jgi:4-amino-4-deoxy-L-arabinose transferase-like glycosyltransferase
VPVALRSRPEVWAILALLCGVALALRLWRLDTDLWLDEVFTLTDFLRLPFTEILATFPSQNQHMLYSLLGRASIDLFGESFAAARLPAVLFGVASIWALFLLGRRVAGAREALLACALMTFSYHHVWFSQNARGYSGLLFFSTLSTWLWKEAMTRGTARDWVWYAVSVWLGLWIHMTMVFVIAAHGLVYLSLLPGRAAATAIAAGTLDRGWRWKPFVAWLFAATVVLQSHALALPEFLRSALHEESLESEWINPMWVVTESIRRLADGGLATVVVLGGLVVAGAGLASYARRDWRDTMLLTLPGVLGGGTMLALGHNLWPRFFLFCMGFALLIVVRGIMAIAEWMAARLPAPRLKKLAVPLGVAVCLAGVVVSATTLPRSYRPKQDFSGARQYVESARQPGDDVVAVGLAGLAYRRYYAPEWPFIERRADLEMIQDRAHGVWLVYTLPVHLKAWVPEVWDVVQRDYEIVRVFPGTLGGGDVVVCRWRGRPRVSSGGAE